MNMHNRAESSATTPPTLYGLRVAAVSAVFLLSTPFSSSAETITDSPSINPALPQNTQTDSPRSTSRLSEATPGMEKASALIGRDVRDVRGETIGKIKDLALNPAQQRVPYAVLSLGGVMGAGAKLYAIPLSAFESRGDDGDLVVAMTEQQFQNLRGFDDGNWPADVAAYWSDSSAENQQGDITRTADASGEIVKAQKYMDYEVKDPSGDDLGEVKDLAVDLNSGQILYAVIEHGGVANIGDTLIAVQTSKLSPGRDDDELVLNVTDDQLDRIKGFSDDNWPSALDDRVSLRVIEGGAATTIDRHPCV